MYVESMNQQASGDTNERERNLPPETDGNEDGERLPHVETMKERKLPKEGEDESLLPRKYKKKRKLPELDDDDKGSSAKDENSTSQQASGNDIERKKKLRLESEENEAIEGLPHEENKGEKKPLPDDDGIDRSHVLYSKAHPNTVV